MDRCIIRTGMYKGMEGYIVGYFVDMVKVRVKLNDIENDLLFLHPSEYKLIL